MKRALLIISAAFSATLALVLGLRMSAEAIAVIVGLILGIIASLPATLAVVFILMRRQNKEAQGRYPAGGQPPVVVINTDKPSGRPSVSLPPTYAPGGGRKWTVVGDEETGSPGIEG